MGFYEEAAADSPFLWYRFENSASLTSDVGAASSGNTNLAMTTGTITSIASSNQAIPGLAIRYPPPSASAVYATVGLGSDTFFTPLTSFTAEIWFKRNEITTHLRTILRRFNGGGLVVAIAGNNPAAPYVANGLYLENTDSAGTTVNRIINSTAIINDTTTWHQVVVKSNGTTLSLYLDGALVGTTTALGVNYSNVALWIGNHSSSATIPSISADVDEVVFYKTTLSDARILAHYQAGSTVTGTAVSIQTTPMTASLSTTNVTSRVSTNASNTVTPMTATLSTTNVTVTATDPQRKIIVSNEDYVDQSIIAIDNSSSSVTYAAFGFPTPYFIENSDIETASLLLNASASGGTVSWRVERITAINGGGSSFTSTTTGSVSGTWAESNYENRTIDLAPMISAWNTGSAFLGIIIRNVSGRDQFGDSPKAYIASASSGNPPKMDVRLTPDLGVPVTVVAPAMTVNLSTPQGVIARVTSNVTSTVTGAMAISTESPDANLDTSGSTSAQVDAIVIDLTMPGGSPRNPDYFALVDPIEAWVFSPNAIVYGGEDMIVTVAGSMEVSLAATDVAFNNVTDRTTTVTPMTLSARMVGIYVREADRYIKAIESNSIGSLRWFPLDELSGTVANDIAHTVSTSSSGATVVTGKEDAAYVGDPEFRTEGPQLRPAVAFDGVDDYLSIGTTQTDGPSLNIEFSIKTTDENGTLFTGNSSGFGTSTSREYVRMIDGEIVLENTTGQRYPINKYIADGEWHHVVIVIEHNLEGQTNSRAFVMIDGQVEWTRYTAQLNEDRLYPTAAMASVTSGGTATDHLAGELSHLLVRVGPALTASQIENLYYEWSGALRISVPPSTITFQGTTNNRAKGNVKKLLVLYGGPYVNEAANFTYRSLFANYALSMVETYNKTPNTEFVSHAKTSGFLSQAVVYTPRPFRMRDFLVYAVGYVGQMKSAPGTVKPGVNDPAYAGAYINDKTGDARFLNLQDDLTVDTTEYDVITVMNYPTDNTVISSQGRFDDGSFEPLNTGNLLAGYGGPHNYDVERDKFRDSLLQAAVDGANLWINEPDAASHLGLIQQWDAHITGGFWNLELDDSESARNTLNLRAAELDELHGVPGFSFVGRNGDYRGIYQGIAHRIIAATEPGLTDIDSWEMTERVDRDKYDYWAPNATTRAYDVRFFPQLAVGDKIALNMQDNPLYNGNGGVDTGPGVPRYWIVSARPDGVVGKVISTEPNQTYTWNTTSPINNPWRGNVFTTICERGTVVRGRTIGGRIFMELMDAWGPMRTNHIVDKQWYDVYNTEGADVAAQTWSFDTGRYSEIVILEQSAVERFSKAEGAYITYENLTGTTDREGFVWTTVPYVPMSARGITWLAAAAEIPSGEVRAHVPAMQVAAVTPSPELAIGRNISISVNGAMRIDAELRQPENVDNPNVSEKVLPAVVTLELRGIGKHISVPTMELALTTPNPTGRGGGDRIYVYLEAVNTATLYLKEE